MDNDLVDEYVLLVSPIVRAKGIKLFREAGEQHDLRITESTVLGGGMLALRMTPAASREHRPPRRRGHRVRGGIDSRAMRYMLFVYPGETDEGPTLERVQAMNKYNEELAGPARCSRSTG